MKIRVYGAQQSQRYRACVFVGGLSKSIELTGLVTNNIPNTCVKHYRYIHLLAPLGHHLPLNSMFKQQKIRNRNHMFLLASRRDSIGSTVRSSKHQ
jgi:hypothetical protein